MVRKYDRSPKPPKVKKKMGRPTLYNQELADLICERVATHDLGLPRLCEKYDDMPDHETIRRWLYKYDDFRVNYAQSKMKQADFLAEQCLEICDDSTGDNKIDPITGEEVFNSEHVARARLRVDTRKWLAAKLLPKQYGNKLLLEQKTEENEKLKKELAELREKLGIKYEKEF